MKQLSERRRKLALVVILLGGAASALGHSIHHRLGTVVVFLVVALQLWALVLVVKRERKEG